MSPSNEYSGLISFRIGWLDLLAVQGTLKSLLQHHSSKASIFWHSASLSEKTMAPQSSTLSWKIPWMEEPGGLQSMGSQRVGHDWATSLSLFTLINWRGKWHPLQCSCLENLRDGGAWWAAVYGVSQSRTWLKQLTSRSSSFFIVQFSHESASIHISPPFWTSFPSPSNLLLNVFIHTENVRVCRETARERTHEVE